jgi:hypothetical protein
MGARSRSCASRVRKSKYWNWLKDLDKTIEVLADRLTMSDLGYGGCPSFILTRYPTLDWFEKNLVEVEITDFEEELSKDPIARCVTERLGSHERKQLAALLLDTIQALKSYNAAGRSARRVKKLATEPWRVRTLNKKIAKAQAAMQELSDYARPLDIQLVSLVADACLKKLSVLLTGDRAPEFYESIEVMYPTPRDPVGRGMVQLYWFFRQGCGLKGRESEVRVGWIRNAFWKKYGVDEVPVRSVYETGDSRGCGAVRSAVRRFQEGTFPGINR